MTAFAGALLPQGYFVGAIPATVYDAELPDLTVRTSRQAIARWELLVWSDPRLLDFTHNIHPCEVVSKQDSYCDITKMLFCGCVNFVQYTIKRRKLVEIGCCERYEFQVTVEYYLKDSCENQIRVQEFFEVLDTVVTERMDYTWGGGVSDTRRPLGYPVLRRFGIIDGQGVYFGSYTYFATT